MTKTICDFCKLESKYTMGSVDLYPYWKKSDERGIVVRKDICKDCAKTLELDDTQ